MNNYVQAYVRVDRLKSPIKARLFKPHYEVKAVNSDQAEEQFGKALYHLIESYDSSLTIKRETFSVPNVQAHAKVYTLTRGNKELASVSLMYVLTSDKVNVTEYKAGEL